MAAPLIPLTEYELTKMRTPRDLSDWWTRKNDEIWASEQGREVLRLHKGLAKPFMEELWPLSKFGFRKFGNSEKVFLQLVIGKQHYDAVLTDKRSEINLQSYLEITQSHDGEDQYLRDLVLYKTGSVNTYGKVIKTGTKKKGIRVEVKQNMVNIEKAAENDLNNILAAAKNKAGKIYPANTSLIIFFDDRLHFPRVIDDTKLDDFVKNNILCLDLKFSSLYLVGFDHVFGEFDLNKF